MRHATVAITSLIAIEQLLKTENWSIRETDENDSGFARSIDELIKRSKSADEKKTV